MQQRITTDYGKARRIYYNFNIGQEEVVTDSIRKSLTTFSNRTKGNKIFKSKKTEGGIKVWRHN